jgi:hypothetical protein
MNTLYYDNAPLDGWEDRGMGWLTQPVPLWVVLLAFAWLFWIEARASRALDVLTSAVNEHQDSLERLVRRLGVDLDDDDDQEDT